MAGRFELMKTNSGQFHFTLKATNGQVVLSSQSYVARADAINGIESVRKNAALDAHFGRRVSAANEPYFVLVAANGQIIGTSQMYSSPVAMESGIASVKENAADAAVDDLTA